MAQRVTSRLSYVQGDLRRVEDLRRRVDDVAVLWQMAEEEDDPGTRAEVERELESLAKAVGELEVRTLLSGEYDPREAVVTIRAEAGGVDAADFAEMLMRMYLRWSERHNYPTEVYDTSYAEEAGIKSATFSVNVPYAYGTLSVEQGTHRLVRISPFDNQGRRQTSFAGRRGGAGRRAERPHRHPGHRHPHRRVPLQRAGRPERQHDRLGGPHHPPAHRHRRLLPEREVADPEPGGGHAGASVRLLERRRMRPSRARRPAADTSGSWGNQMRSYVLHPYQMVKDLRTEYEVGNPQAVLDGEIDDFIEAGIRWRMRADKSLNCACRPGESARRRPRMQQGRPNAPWRTA
jgi:peptide chain release factor 2